MNEKQETQEKTVEKASKKVADGRKGRIIRYLIIMAVIVFIYLFPFILRISVIISNLF